MRRRDFVTLLGGTVAAWPLAVQAQKLAQTQRVSVLLGLTENDPLQNARLKAFRLGMRDLEWIEGRNIQIEYRFAGANLTLINQHVAELIRSAPDAIVANSTPVTAAPLESATSTIPIVFVIVNDPAGQGFIPNLTQ